MLMMSKNLCGNYVLLGPVLAATVKLSDSQ